MINIQLDSDEAIIFETQEVSKWRTENGIVDSRNTVNAWDDIVETLKLTNKRIIAICRKNINFFKSENYIKFRYLNEIKVVMEKVMIEEEKDLYLEKRVRIQFLNTTDYIFFSSNLRSSSKRFIKEINNVILGQEVSNKKEKTRKTKIIDIYKTEEKNNYSDIEQESNIENKTARFDKYCCKCGAGAHSGAKFCNNCGSPFEDNVTNDAFGTDRTKYNERFKTSILKCPSCGEIVGTLTAICSVCGFVFPGQNATRDFDYKMRRILQSRVIIKPTFRNRKEIEAEEKRVFHEKLTLITTYSVPNTVDDICEFINLAVANININLSKENSETQNNINEFGGTVVFIQSGYGGYEKQISDAWVSKLKQLRHQAWASFPKHPAINHVENQYNYMMKELNMISDVPKDEPKKEKKKWWEPVYYNPFKKR